MIAAKERQPIAVSAGPLRRRVVALALGSVLAIAAASCGFGTHDDTGGPVPGQWWPWVCPDGTRPVTDGDPGRGCAPVHPTDAGVDRGS